MGPDAADPRSRRGKTNRNRETSMKIDEDPSVPQIRHIHTREIQASSDPPDRGGALRFTTRLSRHEKIWPQAGLATPQTGAQTRHVTGGHASSDGALEATRTARDDPLARRGYRYRAAMWITHTCRFSSNRCPRLSPTYNNPPPPHVCSASQSRSSPPRWARP